MNGAVIANATKKCVNGSGIVVLSDVFLLMTEFQ
jgi:hypothetical protein